MEEEEEVVVVVVVVALGLMSLWPFVLGGACTRVVVVATAFAILCLHQPRWQMLRAAQLVPPAAGPVGRPWGSDVSRQHRSGAATAGCALSNGNDA